MKNTYFCRTFSKENMHIKIIALCGELIDLMESLASKYHYWGQHGSCIISNWEVCYGIKVYVFIKYTFLICISLAKEKKCIQFVNKFGPM